MMSRKHLSREACDTLSSACRAYERQYATRGGVERSAVQRLSLHFDTHRDDPDNVLLGLRATHAVDDAVVSPRSFDIMARVRESEQALVAPQLHRDLLSWLTLSDAELLFRARALARCALEVWPVGALVLVPDDASGGTGRMCFGRFSGRRVGLTLGVFTSPAERTDSLYQLAHVLPVPTHFLGTNNLRGGVECAFATFRTLETAAVRRGMVRFLTLHGFDNDLNESLEHPPDAPQDVRACSVHALHRNERLLSQMKRSHSQNRERCVAYVRRAARAAAVRMARHCDNCLRETLEHGESAATVVAAIVESPAAAAAGGGGDTIGMPLVTDLIDNLRALPEHATRMVAVLDRELQASAARHRAASRALSRRLEAVRMGTAKVELHAWWTALIKEATLNHMRAVGVDLSAVTDDYTTRAPADLNLVRRNSDILAALLDAENDTLNTKTLLDSMCNAVYPRVNQFIDDALVAVAIACAVPPSTYERQYDASALLSSLRSHVADALVAELRPLSKSSRDDEESDNAATAASAAVLSSAIGDEDSDLDTASDSPHENIRSSGNFLARRSMSSISGGLCLSDSDRSVISIANAFGFGSSSSVGTSLQWCETTLDDVEYLITMKQLERAGVSAERLGPVPVSGLIVGRITRCLQEHRTVLELFGDGDATARVRSTSARSVLANVSLFRRRRADVDGSLSPRSPRFWFSRSNRVGGGGGSNDSKRGGDAKPAAPARTEALVVGTNDNESLGSANSDAEDDDNTPSAELERSRTTSTDAGERAYGSVGDDDHSHDAQLNPRNQHHRHSDSSSHYQNGFGGGHRRTRHRHSDAGSTLTANGSIASAGVFDTGDSCSNGSSIRLDSTDDDDNDNDDDDDNSASFEGKLAKLVHASNGGGGGGATTTTTTGGGGFTMSQTFASTTPQESSEGRWQMALSQQRRRKSEEHNIAISAPTASAGRTTDSARMRGAPRAAIPPVAAAMHRLDKATRNLST
jgi:hypothetical protein